MDQHTLGIVINPGQMRYPVTVENRAYTRSESGEQISDGSPTTFHVMAARQYMSGSETEKSGRQSAIQQIKFTTRYDSRITTKSKLVESGVTYDVEQISIIGPMRYMDIIVKVSDHGSS